MRKNHGQTKIFDYTGHHAFLQVRELETITGKQFVELKPKPQQKCDNLTRALISG